MPTYQYACTECSHAFEQFQNFADDSLTTCPKCEGRLRKVFNAVGVVFKGSGFYRTDSRADGRGGSAPAAPATGEKSSSGDKSAPEKSSSDKKTAPAAAAATGSASSSSSSSSSTSD